MNVQYQQIEISISLFEQFISTIRISDVIISESHIRT